MQVLSSFVRGIFFGLICGVLLAIALLTFLFLTVGLNDSNGLINAYTLFLCAIFGFIGSTLGGIIGLIKGLVSAAKPHHSRVEDNGQDDAPIAKP